MKVKKFLKKTWHFIWDDDSIWSWLLNVVLAFVLIKFIVYPGLGLILSTTHPIVAVVSGSMEHDGTFEDWWNSKATCETLNPCSQEQLYFENGITKEQFRKFTFSDGFNTGDIMVLYGTKIEKIKLGDVIVFRGNKPDPIIHRVIGIREENGKIYYHTKGDHNMQSIPKLPNMDENNIPQDNIVGRAVFRVPYLGWIKMGFVKLIELVRF